MFEEMNIYENHRKTLDSSMETISRDVDSYQPFDMDPKLFHSRMLPRKRFPKCFSMLKWILAVFGVLALAALIVLLHLNLLTQVNDVRVSFNSQTERINKTLQKVNRENVHLRSLLQLQINKTLKLNFHAENLENNFEELQDTAAYLESENTALRQRMRQQDAEINDHENITESLHEKIQVLEVKAEGFQKENIELQSQISAHGKQSKRLEQKAENLTSESINMQAHIRFQAFLLTRLENASESLGNKISQLQSKANVQEDETRSLELDYNKLRQFLTLQANVSDRVRIETDLVKKQTHNLTNLVVFLLNMTNALHTENQAIFKTLAIESNSSQEIKNSVTNLMNQTANFHALANTLTQGYVSLDEGWVTPFNGYKYKYIQSSTNWNSARANCYNMGGDLAAFGIQDMRTRRILKIALNFSYYYCWIGLNDISSEGTWRWIGTYSSYNGNQATDETALWAKNQPGYSSSRDCAAMHYDELLLHDLSCYSNYYYLCEKAL